MSPPTVWQSAHFTAGWLFVPALPWLLVVIAL
jgi:hypothetical protein